MGVTIREGEFLRIFLRNKDLELPLGSVKNNIEDNIKDKIIDRISRGKYLGGSWATKGYSFNKIKAYKLGNLVMSGSGRSQTMTINGILIDRDDWYWGGYTKDKTEIWSNGRKIPNKGNFPIAEQKRVSSRPRHFAPLPIFIPGYRKWRTKYNALSSTVNLNFNGDLWKNIDVRLNRKRGANQFGENAEIDITVLEPFKNIGEAADYFRNYLEVTNDELKEAIKESGLELAT